MGPIQADLPKHIPTQQEVLNEEARFCIDTVKEDIRKNTTYFEQYPDLEFTYLGENKVGYGLPGKDIRKVERVEDNGKIKLIYQKTEFENSRSSLMSDLLLACYWETKDENGIARLYAISKEDRDRAFKGGYDESYDKFITFKPERKSEIELNSPDYIAAYETVFLAGFRQPLRVIFEQGVFQENYEAFIKSGVNFGCITILDLKKLVKLEGFGKYVTQEELEDMYKIAKAKFKYQVGERRFYDFGESFSLEDIMQFKDEFSKQEFNEILRNFTKGHMDEQERAKKRKEEQRRIIEEGIKDSLNRIFE